MYFLYLSIEFSTEIDMSIKKIKSKENNIIKNKNSKFSFKDLNSIRSRIDLIDDNIHELLINRAKLVEKVAKTKKSLMEKSLGLYRPDREHAILKRIISNQSSILCNLCLICYTTQDCAYYIYIYIYIISVLLYLVCNSIYQLLILV